MSSKKRYNIRALGDVVHKRITERRTIQKQQKAKLDTLWGKENVPSKVIYR